MTEPQSNARPRPVADPPAAAGVTHIRRRLDADFTILSNRLALRPGSFVTIGLGAYLMAVPPGTVVSIAALRRDYEEGETRLARALRELEDEGFLERVRVQGPDGRFRTRTYVYNDPEPRGALRPGEAGPPVSVPVPARDGADVSGTDADPGDGPGAGADPAPGAGGMPGGLPSDRGGTAPGGRWDAGAVADRGPRPVPDASVPPPSEAARVLARLRVRDPRLLLSEREIAELAPAVGEWLRRGVGPQQLLHVLTADLPDRILRRPARLLAYRLRNNLPPRLPEPAAPGADHPASPAPPAVLPLRNCSGCDRAFRSEHLLRCRGCTDAEAAGQPVGPPPGRPEVRRAA